MSQAEIPLLRESAAFSHRLLAAARAFGDATYHFHRRVNWSHRFSDRFYRREAECFALDSADYLAGRSRLPPDLPDVFEHRLNGKAVANVIVKVLAHWLFATAGGWMRAPSEGLTVYRKCYVEDIELVFDPQEPAVLRAVYPFPLNSVRQFRYWRYLRRRRLPYRPAGNPYLGRDLLAFLLRRDIRSMMRLESRAQVRLARRLVSQGFKTFQLSDEFNLGSLDFSRALARQGASVVNSAHGVGKYLPVHAYQRFFVLTRRQIEYYHPVLKCRYELRTLNDLAEQPTREILGAHGPLQFVFLSQTFAGLTRIVIDHESAVLARLRAEFGRSAELELYFKAHPTSTRDLAPEGFKSLASIRDLDPRRRTIFASFFSTCQIDPSFKGRKILIRGALIHPEISFDDDEEILALDQLVEVVRNELHTEPAHA